MFLLGFLLILVGAAAVVAAVFTAEGTVQLLGLDLSALTIFFVGVAAAVAVQWGLGLLRFGTKRSLKQRKERKKLSRLSAKLDKVDAEREESGDQDG